MIGDCVACSYDHDSLVLGLYFTWAFFLYLRIYCAIPLLLSRESRRCPFDSSFIYLPSGYTHSRQYRCLSVYHFQNCFWIVRLDPKTLILTDTFRFQIWIWIWIWIVSHIELQAFNSFY